MVSAAQRDEAGWEGATGRPETWEEFDALPLGVKKIYWSAPYQYTAIRAYQALIAGYDMRLGAIRQLHGFAKDVRREALRLYGPHHPQAGASE